MVLKCMCCKYIMEFFGECLNCLKEVFFGLVIILDVIVGFLGEIEEEFMEMYNFIKEYGFLEFYVFLYFKCIGMLVVCMID